MKKRFRFIRFLFIAVAVIICHAPLTARELNNRLMNRPYSDLRAFHFGFGVGTHLQDFTFTHSGELSGAGEQWFVEQPGFSPGFNVSGIVDFRLAAMLNLRLSPGIYFGNRSLTFREENSGTFERQDVKSAYIVLPVDLKFSAIRWRNTRPYLTGGIMPSYDAGRRGNGLLKFKSVDFFLSVGFGCDFYLPYFKLIPELKFCFGMSDILDRNRPDLADTPDGMKYTNALKKVTSSMVVLTFYFE